MRIVISIFIISLMPLRSMGAVSVSTCEAMLSLVNPEIVERQFAGVDLAPTHVFAARGRRVGNLHISRDSLGTRKLVFDGFALLQESFKNPKALNPNWVPESMYSDVSEWNEAESLNVGCLVGQVCQKVLYQVKIAAERTAKPQVAYIDLNKALGTDALGATISQDGQTVALSLTKNVTRSKLTPSQQALYDVPAEEISGYSFSQKQLWVELHRPVTQWMPGQQIRRIVADPTGIKLPLLHTDENLGTGWVNILSDGQQAILFGDRTDYIYELSSGRKKPIGDLDGHGFRRDDFRFRQFTPSGSDVVYAGLDGQVVIYSRKDLSFNSEFGPAEAIHLLPKRQPGEDLRSISVSNDGRNILGLIVGNDGSTAKVKTSEVVWMNLDNKRKLLLTQFAGASEAGFSATGRWVYGIIEGKENTIRILDTKDFSVRDIKLGKHMNLSRYDLHFEADDRTMAITPVNGVNSYVYLFDLNAE